MDHFYFIYLFIYFYLFAQNLDCGLEVSKFELQSCYFVHFRINTIGKGMIHPL